MKRLRYGLLGAGMMGQEHMRNLRLLEEVELVAFMDTDEYDGQSRAIDRATGRAG